MNSNEEVYSHGFVELNKDENTNFKLTNIDIKSSIKGDIVSLSVGMECLVIATKQGIIVRQQLKEGTNLKMLELPPNGGEIYKTFMDAYGYHCIIVTTNNNVFYLHYKSDIIIPLELFKGLTITAIGFGLDVTPSTTRSLLVGTKIGQLLTYCISDTDTSEIIEEKPKAVLQLPGNHPVCGIVFDTYKRKVKQNDNMGKSENIGYTTLVMVFTVESYYYFTGTMPFSELFKGYNLSGKINEHRKRMPHEKLKESELKLFYRINDKIELGSFVWKTEIAACHADFRLKSAYESSIRIVDLAIEGYKKKNMKEGETIEAPEAVGVTDLYLLLLYNDSLIGISKITKQIEHVEFFRSEGKMIQMAHEPGTNSMWICSSRRLYRLTIRNKDKNLWRQKLESSNFAEALKLCKANDGKYYGYVAGIYADSKFKHNNFLEAAEYYAISTRSFEDVIIKFLLANNSEGLEKYLTLKLNNIASDKELKTQQVLLSVWIFILKLKKLKKTSAMLDNDKERDEISPKRRAFQNEMLTTQKQVMEVEAFLEKYKNCFNTDTIFQLLDNYGRSKEYIKLAIENSKTEAVVVHYINDNDIKSALKYLKNVKDEDKNRIMIKYASIFMKRDIELTIDCLSSNFPNIKIESLVPALMSFKHKNRGLINDFLSESMKRGKNQILSNIYVFFLAEDSDKKSHKKLLDFISKQELLKKRNRPLDIDKDFALSVCKYFKRTEAQIKIYGILDFYEKAVNLALDNNMIELAKVYANLYNDSKIRRKLWIKILRSTTSKKEESYSILNMVEESEGSLTLSDVFPYISSNAKIKEFSKVLLMHLKNHESKISDLDKEIKEYNKSSNELLKEQKEYRSNFIEFSSNKCCDNCEKPLVSDPKYFIFPCLHGFHMRCLINKQLSREHEDIMLLICKRVKMMKLESRMKMLRGNIEYLEKKSKRKLRKKMEYFLIKLGFPCEIGEGVEVISYAKKLLKKRAVVLNEKQAIEIRLEEYRSLKNKYYSLAGIYPSDAKTYRYPSDGETYCTLESYNKQFEKLLVEECLQCGNLAIETIDVVFDSAAQWNWAL